MSHDKIFVIKYKSQNEYCKINNGNPVYVTQFGFPTVDINNAGLYETSNEAYKRAVLWKIDKDTIGKEV